MWRALVSPRLYIGDRTDRKIRSKMAYEQDIVLN